MTVKVKDILEQATNNEFRCVAGFNGLNRQVTDFSIIDTPDVLMWLKGGELVMATGYIFSMNPHMIDSIISDLVDKKCAGLAFKMKRYYDSIPEEIILAGNRLDFPIIELPYDLPVSDFSRLVYYNIFYRENIYKDKAYSISNKLLGYLNAHDNIDNPLSIISQYIPNPSLLLNNRFELELYAFPSSYSKEDIDSLGLDLTISKLFLSPEIIEDINYLESTLSFKNQVINYRGKRINLFSIKNGEDLGYLLFLEDKRELSHEDYRIIEAIMPTISLFMSYSQNKNSYLLSSDGFVKKILLASPVDREDILNQCRIYNFNTEDSRLALVIEIKDYLLLNYQEKNSIYTYLEKTSKKILEEANLDYFYRFYQNKFIFYVFFDDSFTSNSSIKKSEELASLIYKKSLEDHPNTKLKIGISLASSDIEDIQDNFKEALAAIDLGSKIYQSRNIFSYNEDILAHMLNSFNLDRIEKIYYNTVYELDKFDEENDSLLLESLEAYIKNQKNLSKTAESLFIHRNTVRYRLNQIRDILNIDLENEIDNSNLLLGIYAKKILASKL